MNTLFNRVKRIIPAFFILVPLSSFAQDENDLVNFLQAGKEDASKMMNAYLNPLMEGFSYGFNGGWFTTAKAHKSLGVDFGFSVNAVSIPSSKNYFDVNTLGLKTTTLLSPAGGKAPTIIGPDQETTFETGIDTNGDGTVDETAQFSGPQGLDMKENLKVSGVVVPTVQLGVGIYKNTDLKIRWIPEVDAGSSKIRLIGFGVLHDIKQHIPGIKRAPFDLSVLVAFTKVNGSTGLEGKFTRAQNDNRAQEIDYKMNAWLFQALVSKKIAIVTFYGGIGYNTVKTTSDVTGSYVIYDAPNPTQDLVLNDPVSLSFKNKSLRLTGGIRLNFGPVYLTGDYTVQEYGTLTAGLGFTFR